MTNGLFSMFSSLIANTPPYRKGLSSRKFLSLFLILFLAVGNVWGATDFSKLNYSGENAIPSGYTLSGKNAPNIADITSPVSSKSINISNGGASDYSAGNLPTKRFMTFVIDEGCSVVIKFTSSSAGRTLNLVPASTKTAVASVSVSSKNAEHTLSYEFSGITSATTYYLCGTSSSNLYIYSIQFTPTSACTEAAPTSVAVSGGATYDKGDALSNMSAAVTGGTGTMSYQWYCSTTNAATVDKEHKIDDATSATLAPYNKVGTRYYYCVVSNCAGSVTSGTTAVTINANCSATGDIFTMTMNSSNAPSSEVKTPASSTMSIDTYINIDGGDIVLVTGSSQHSSITTSPKIKLGGSSGYAKITLDCPLQEGDKITFVKTNKIALAADASGTNKIQLASGTNEYTVTKEDCLYNQSNLFVLRDGSNVEISAITITRPVYRTVTLKYADGVTADGSLDALDGAPAIQPTDPTWEHHRFDGWYNGATPYDWAANVTDDLTLTAHWTQLYTITYAAGDGTATGDAPTQVDKAEGETFTVAANTFEVAGKDFDIWNDGSADYAPGATYTVGTANVVLTAQWKAQADKYTVKFMDGETELGTKLFEVSTNPSDADINKTKALNTFAAWQKEGVDIALDDAFWATVAKDATVTLTARWTPKYASSFDFGETTDLTKDNIMSKLSAVNILVTVGTGGGYDDGATTGYLGYKFKNKGDKVSFLLQKGYRTIITFGFTQSGWTINGEDLDIALATKDYVEKIYTATDADVLYTLVNKSEDGKTSVITKIIIEEIPDISDDATLKDLKVNGTTIAEFNSATKIYYLTVPYGTEVANMPKITEATANHASAAAVIYPNEGPEWTEEYGGCYLQQVVVTAEDGTKGYYHVRTTVDAKQGVTIIKATHTGATTANVIGAIGGTCDKNTQADGKLGSNGHYFGIKLAEGTFKSGDVIKVVASALNGGNTITLFADNEGTTEIGSVAYDQSTKTAYFTLTADVENVYIYRVSSACNSNVEYIEVQRFMDPFIESFEVAGVQGVVDEESKTIAVEVSASTVVTALTPTIVAWANGGATVTPTGPQDFTSPVTYEVSSAYAEDGTTKYTVTVTKAAASADATLKTLTINGNALTLVDGVYEYDYELPYGTTIAPVVVAEANDANATAVVTSVSLTEAVITVTAENDATQEYVINFTISPWQNIVIWDGSTMEAVAASPDASGLTWEVNGFGDIANYTTTCGSKTYSKVLPSGGSASDSRNFKIVIPDGYLAKFYIAFASHSDGALRGMSIGTTINKNSDTSIYGAECSTRSEALGGTSVIVGAGTYYINPRASIDFCEVSVLLRPGYIRPGLTVGSLGTICLPSNVPAGQAFGATFYELVGKEPQYGKIVFDEILSGELVAGKPYLFQAQSDVLYCFYGTESVSDPDNSGAMKGTFVNLKLTDLTNIYYFAQKALWSCVDLTELSVPANRAYVKMDEMPAISESNLAPGVRRIVLGTNESQVATGVDQVQGDEVPTKMIINGQLFILRGEKMYDAQGKLVK